MTSPLISRRAALGALMGLAAGARAMGPGTGFHIAQLMHEGRWDARPEGPDGLALEARSRTSIDVEPSSLALQVRDPSLFRYPFLVMCGDARFRFEADERERLRRWFSLGGMLFADNAGRTGPSTAFDGSLREELGLIFPDRGLEKVPQQHVIYRTFYVLDFPAGRAIHRTYLEGLTLDGRLAVLYSQNDVFGALDREAGDWRFDVIPGGDSQRERAIRLAVNVVMYALCLDYKDDQAHTDYLLHERRWRAAPPRVTPSGPEP